MRYYILFCFVGISILVHEKGLADGEVLISNTCESICDTYQAITAVYVGPIEWDSIDEESSGQFFRLVVLVYEEYQIVIVEFFSTGPEGIERRLQSRYEFDARSFPETVYLSSLATPGEVKLTWTDWDVLEMTFQGTCFKLGLAPEEANFQISKCSEE